MTVFNQSTIDAVLRHMNGDHTADNLVIAQAFGDRLAHSATMVGLDGDGGEWSYSVGDDIRFLAVPWSAPIVERQHIRREVVVVFDRASSVLHLPIERHD